jgi:hypothetical protein
VHNKIELEKHLLRTVVLRKVLVVTHATGCKTQRLILLPLFLFQVKSAVFNTNLNRHQEGQLSSDETKVFVFILNNSITQSNKQDWLLWKNKETSRKIMTVG